LGLLIAAGLMAYAFSRGGVDSITRALQNATFGLLAPAVLCEVVVQLARSLKWTAILRTVAPVKFRNVLSAVVLGGASTHLVPLRLDEVLRAGLLSRREGIPMATVLGTVALDRIFEVLVLGVLVGLVALSGDLQPWMRAGAAVMWVGFAAPNGFSQGRTPSVISLVHSKACMLTKVTPRSAVATISQKVFVRSLR
jgi:hypothetical protein